MANIFLAWQNRADEGTLSGSWGSWLAALPVTAEIATLLERQRDRFQSITREKLAAEAEVLGTRLDAMPRWPLDEVDHVVRLGHRLVTVLPVRETILRALEAAIAQRSPVPK
jgi:hypothetical protein